MTVAWWQDPQNLLAEIENEDWGVTHLMYRNVNGIHVYAIVRWAWSRCELVMEFEGGKVIKSL